MEGGRQHSETQRVKDFIQRMSLLHHHVSWRLLLGVEVAEGKRNLKKVSHSRPTTPQAVLQRKSVSDFRSLLHLTADSSVASRFQSVHGRATLDLMTPAVASVTSPNRFTYSLSGMISPPLAGFCHWYANALNG